MGGADPSGRAEVGILGPLTVTVAGTGVPAGGGRQRTVLAVLAAAAGQVVSADTLAEAVWGDQAIERSRGTLHVYVSNLRRVLGGASTIIGRPPGYALDTAMIDVDATSFQADAEAGRTALEAGRFADASALLRSGLSRWRGEFLADLDDVDTLSATATRLTELRLAALEDCFDAELELGRHEASVPELDAACRDNPLRERLWGQLMLALYRSGRQADALQAYQRARDSLVDELGLDPGPELRRLEQSILEQSGSLDPASDAGPALLWLDGAGRMRRTVLRSPGPLTIGRAEGNTIRLEWDSKVSRRHASVEDVDGWRITDEGSSNGTWRNSERVEGSTALDPGDLLRCGGTTLFVRFDRTDATRPPAEETLLAGS